MKQTNNQSVERGLVHLFFVPTLFVIMATFVALTASFVFGQTFSPPHTIGLGGTTEVFTSAMDVVRIAFGK